MARALVKKLNDGGPVGSVIQSMLDLAQFQAENGINWVLADGANVSGSRYEAVTGNAAIPDLRGRFLRGKNNGRISGANPDGEFNLGQEQGQGTAKNALSASSNTVGDHQHSSNQSSIYGGSTLSAPGYSSNVQGAGYGGGSGGVSPAGSHSHTITLGPGNNETRPENTCVNYFIKIN